MRVYGLTSPVRSFGWVVALGCCGMVLVYPAFPGLLLAQGYPGNAGNTWMYDVVHVFASGGIAWQVGEYLRWHVFTHNPWTNRTIFIEFAPLCFLPVVLPFSVLILWRHLLTYAISPSILRGLLSVSLAFVGALAIIFLLDQVVGRALLYVLRISFWSDLAIRGLIATIWSTALMQAVLLLLPSLVLGGFLARHQVRLEARASSRPRSPGTAGQANQA